MKSNQKESKTKEGWINVRIFDVIEACPTCHHHNEMTYGCWELKSGGKFTFQKDNKIYEISMKELET